MRVKKITKCSDGAIKRKITESILKWNLTSKFQIDNDLIKYEFGFQFRSLFNREETKFQTVSVFLGPDQEKQAFRRAINSFKVQYFKFIKEQQLEEQK